MGIKISCQLPHSQKNWPKMGQKRNCFSTVANVEVKIVSFRIGHQKLVSIYNML